MKKYAIILFMLLFGFAQASSNTINTNLSITIIGLPPGANVPLQIQNPLGVYNTNNYPITDWTTVITIPYNTQEVNIYSGQVPYQWMGAGTTLTYQGTTYTVNELALAGFNGFIMSNTIKYRLPFYAFYNAMQWNAQQANELIAAGVNPNSSIIIGLVGNSTQSLPYGSVLQSGNYIKVGNQKKFAKLENGNINFVTTNVVKNPSYICINMTG